MEYSTDFLSLQNRLLIREAAEQYFYLADSHDAVGVAACFARDGVFRSATQTEMRQTGREAIEQGFRSYAKWGRTFHHISSMNIEIDGETAASKLFAISYVAGAAREGDPIRVRGLTYADRWIVEHGKWVLLERVHEAIWQFEETQMHTRLPDIKIQD